MDSKENNDGRSDCESGWSIATYAAHNEALRKAEEKFQIERDRRYAEVKSAEEKALKVKEQADRDALGLAREIQTYKDEKANELREQINRERGLYVTQTELQSASKEIIAMVRPLTDYVSANQGKSVGMSDSWKILLGAVGLILTLLNIAGIVFSIYIALKK